MSGNRSESLLAFLRSPTMAAIVAGVFTGFLGPYLLEEAKSNSVRQYIQQYQHQAIVDKQLEVLEHANHTLWNYRTAAYFLVFDFINGQPNQTALVAHLVDYEKTARSANTELGASANRAEFYFKDNDVRDQLYTVFTELFEIDTRIYLQLDAQDRSPDNRSAASDKIWADIQTELDRITGEIKQLLTTLSNDIGDVPQSL